MVPFDARKLEILMKKSGLDLLLANSRHNVRYLTGGYYFHFHAHATRLGQSQYLPFVGLPRRDFAETFYIGRSGEEGQMEAEHLWIRSRPTASRGTIGAAEAAAQAIRGLGLGGATIGIEFPFLPGDALLVFQKALPRATFVDATVVLDQLRAVKTPHELTHLRTVYNRTAQAIHAAFSSGKPGVTTAAIADCVRREMANRGLTFLWAFTCAGPGLLRAPSGTPWENGRVLHIDAGGEDADYLADICRMACLGDPSPLARDLLDACLDVQGRVRKMVRPGLPSSEVLRHGQQAVRDHLLASYGRFVAHGIGMVSHEQPNISSSNPCPLEAGMVLSIETEFIHPEVGHVKIEDAVAVTEEGCEGLGDLGREWHVVPV